MHEGDNYLPSDYKKLADPKNETLDEDTVLMLTNVSVLIMNNETLMRLPDGRSRDGLFYTWHPKCEVELTPGRVMSNLLCLHRDDSGRSNPSQSTQFYLAAR